MLHRLVSASTPAHYDVAANCYISSLVQDPEAVILDLFMQGKQEYINTHVTDHELNNFAWAMSSR